MKSGTKKVVKIAAVLNHTVQVVLTEKKNLTEMDFDVLISSLEQVRDLMDVAKSIEFEHEPKENP